MKVVLNFEEVKKAVTYYVAKKFILNPDSIKEVEIEKYDDTVSIHIQEDSE